jgi:hypothetical protein
MSIILKFQVTILLSYCIGQMASSVTNTPIVDVVICGGGLGGLALANGLINDGFSVACFEKNGKFRPTGAMTGLAPNAFKALNHLKPGGSVYILYIHIIYIYVCIYVYIYIYKCIHI